MSFKNKVEIYKQDETNNLETLRSQILNEHNRLRSDPYAYIPFLENRLKFIKEDNTYNNPGQNIFLLREGKSSFLDAIEFLKRQNPVKTLTFDERLSKSAQEFSDYLGKDGIISLINNEGQTAVDRIEKYCEWDTALAESIDYGSNTAQEILISLLVDDGNEKRGHRHNLFSNELKYIGIGVSTHKLFNTVTVINYVGGLREKGLPFFDYENYKYEYPKGVNIGLQNIVKKERKFKNQLQLKDEDAPDNAINCKIVKKLTNNVNNDKAVLGVRRIIRKIYDLEDGTQHIIEIEDV